MRKFKFLTGILSLMVFFGSLTACNPGTSSQNSSSSSAHTCESVCPDCGGCLDAECEDAACEAKCDCEETPPAHECESVCPECGGCLDATCTEEACADKCEGHAVTPPAHECESVCPECGGCLDAECQEAACADKCDCEETPPAHECESVCPECGGCLDATCTEEACADKCDCEETPPAHECESVCPECGKCLDATCTEEACADKCEGHTVTPPAHECESVCPECGKCLDATCTEEACADKCEGHTVTPPAHECESVCPECGKCLDATCTEAACADKCEGHTVTPPAHECESVCPECGKCLDATCTEEACEEKCEGHTVTPPAHECESVCPECGKCLDATCTEEACEEKCEGHTVTPPAHECESVCPDCGGCLDATCTEEACEEKCEGHDAVVANWTSYELNVVSFNVRIPSDTGDAAWRGGRGNAVVNFINTCGADIIGLQEVNETPYEAISSGLAINYEMIYTDAKTMDATIYDKTVFNLVDTDMYHLPDENGEDAIQMATVLILEHRVTGEKIKAINCHAHHGSTYSNLRKVGFNYIAQRSLSDDDYKFTVMVGDFNASLKYKADYASISNKLDDCRVNAIESPNRDSYTFVTLPSEVEAGKALSRTIYDYIFVTRSEDVEVLTYQVRQDTWGDNKRLSDHYPIQSTIKIYNPNRAWTGFY